MNNKKPVLFLIFNRPETTNLVFGAIRKYKPQELYIAADGPRKSKPGEKGMCEETRKITEKIDWPCKVKRLYRDKNLGCKYAVSGAVDWFFKNVEEGIILEDDCLPNPSFFDYCEMMLEKYRANNKIMHIGGNSVLPRKMQNSNIHYITKYSHIWGWATWRRAWKKYDVEMGDWSKYKKSKYFANNFDSLVEKLYWTVMFDFTYNRKIDTWDYQWLYTIWRYNCKSISPGVNLIENIGNLNGTHMSIGTKISKPKTISKKSYLDSNSVERDTYEAKYFYKINFLMVVMQYLYLSLSRS